MLLIVNAALYVLALGFALAVLRRAPDGPRHRHRIRTARATLVFGGGPAMAYAIALSFGGHWFLSAVAGCAALVIVSGCLWFALGKRFMSSDDDDDGPGGGGGPHKRPEPPAPTQPIGGPQEELWAQFDDVRAGWERERDPTPA
ncbi:MAG: hypothetical protein Q8O56_15965 [Solirubrobacteraceae bacterium]|nr:hypothetical protein [Solirubrobacteraceae bacterium]